MRPVLERRGQVTGRIESVKDHMAACPGAGRYEPLRPACEIERRPPRSIDAQHPPVFAGLRTHRHPEVFRALLPRARIVGDHPLVLTSDRRALLESTFDLDQLNANPVMSGPLPRARRASGTHMALLNPWCRAYFHWMLDTLPRAALLPLDEHPDVPVIVPAALARFQRESLELIGVDESRLVPFDGTQLRTDELWFPSLVGRTGNPPRWALEWLGSMLAPERAATPSRKLYVSRADADTRAVANEADVVALLGERGFEVFVPGNLSLGEQMSLFSEAAAIAGPHGAGLVNTLAAQTATVVELFEPRYVNGCYYALSDALGHNYWYLMCEPSGESDLLVDLDRLGATLDRAGV